MNKKLLPLMGGVFLLAASPAFAAFSVSLSPSLTSPQPVGTTITWTATVSGDPDTSPVYEYQFSANLTGSTTLVRRGYASTNTFPWTPSSADGAFTVGVIVKNVHAFTEATNTASFHVSTRLPAGTCATDPAACAAVNTTNHPLVALFSAVSCTAPNSMVVFFKAKTAVPSGGITALQQTSPQPCRHSPSTPDSSSMNFYIAGMYPSTTYKMYYETISPSNTVVHTGPTLHFTTGSIPSNVYLATYTPSGTTTDTAEPIILHSVITVPNGQGHIYANGGVDLAGNVLWYSTNLPLLRTEPGGNYFGGGAGGLPNFREIDLAGNTVLETNAAAISEQLVAMGQKPITGVHHEVRRMVGPTSAAPTGYLMMLGSSEAISPTEADCFFDPTTLGAQGSTCTSPVDIAYDQIIVLNPSTLRVVWNWDESEHFDLNQAPPLGEKCPYPGGGGCPPITAINYATGLPFGETCSGTPLTCPPNDRPMVDWAHTNSLEYNAYDGNMVLSSRHQDTVFKISYVNGTGDGHVIWELGKNGWPDVNGNPLPLLSVTTNNPVTVGSYDLAYPWNSHQHDANIQIIGGNPFLTLFDDGNERYALDSTSHSRCLMFALNEATLAANLNLDGDVGTYSYALGSSQLLANGNLYCDSGILNEGGVNTFNTNSTETDHTGGAPVDFSMGVNAGSYRVFRMSSMYNNVVY